MTRKSLQREIQLRSNSLNLRQAQFHSLNEQSSRALKKPKPYLWVAIGLIAGVAVSILGWRKVYSLASSGAALYPFIISRSGSPDESTDNE